MLIGVFTGLLSPVLDVTFDPCGQYGKRSDNFNRFRKGATRGKHLKKSSLHMSVCLQGKASFPDVWILGNNIWP